MGRPVAGVGRPWPTWRRPRSATDNDVLCVVTRHQYMSLSHQDLDQTSLNSSTVYVIYLLLFINNIVCHVGLSQARYTRVILYVWLVAASYRVRQEKRTLTKSIISQNWRIIFKSYLFVDIKLIQICQTGHLGRKPSSNWCPYQSTTINTGEKPNTHADIKLNQFKNPIDVRNS